jgi:hypothetical protein
MRPNALPISRAALMERNDVRARRDAKDAVLFVKGNLFISPAPVIHRRAAGGLAHSTAPVKTKASAR